MTRREAVGVLKHTNWIANIERSKQIWKAIETIEKPMDEYRKKVREVERQNQDLSSLILFVVSQAKKKGIEIEYDPDKIQLRYPSDWL